MSHAAFDPYYHWLGIPPKHQPPDHYRLLGIEALEVDLIVVEQAADRQMAHLRTHQSGAHADEAARLLNEVSAARVCLLKDDAKREYDQKLRSQNGASTTAAKPAAPPKKRVSKAPTAPIIDVPQFEATPTKIIPHQIIGRRLSRAASFGIAIIGGVAIGGLLLGIVAVVVFHREDAPPPPPTVARGDATPSMPQAILEDKTPPVSPIAVIPRLPMPEPTPPEHNDVTNTDSGDERALPAPSVVNYASLPGAPSQELMDRIGPSIATVVSLQGSNVEGGSGFVVAPEGIIATSSQVVGDGRRLRVVFQNGRETPVERVLGVHPQWGVAFLQVRQSRPLPVLPWATVQPEPGDHFYTVSGTRRSQIRWSPKASSAVRAGDKLRQELVAELTVDMYEAQGFAPEADWIELSGKNPFLDEQRGGVVVNDEGFVVGISLWSHPTQPRRFWALSVADLKELIAKLSDE